MDDSDLRPGQWRNWPLSGAPPVGGRPDPAGESWGADLVPFLETMPAAFCLLDGEWRVCYVNAEAER
ncbi:MAG: hypothetical protein JF630_17635, partial [Geodermatophilales bacterium]|nr:hypothetical protein [Geodermatophilales bacterium]